jgi:hypothetical protein
MSITFDEKLKFRKLLMAIEDLDGCNMPLGLTVEISNVYSKVKQIIDNEEMII